MGKAKMKSQDQKSQGKKAKMKKKTRWGAKIKQNQDTKAKMKTAKMKNEYGSKELRLAFLAN